MHRYLMTCVLTLALGGAVAEPVFAKDYKGKGTVEYEVVSSKPVGGEDSGKVRMQYQGTVKQMNGTSPVSGNKQTCTGTFTVNEKGETTGGSGYCQGMDKDGDVWVIHFVNGDEKGKWELTWGTGKFEGAKGGGTTNEMPAPGENRLKVGWKGEWTMK